MKFIKIKGCILNIHHIKEIWYDEDTERLTVYVIDNSDEVFFDEFAEEDYRYLQSQLPMLGAQG